jgi:hypothetical protein
MLKFWMVEWIIAAIGTLAAYFFVWPSLKRRWPLLGRILLAAFAVLVFLTFSLFFYATKQHPDEVVANFVGRWICETMPFEWCPKTEDRPRQTSEVVDRGTPEQVPPSKQPPQGSSPVDPKAIELAYWQAIHNKDDITLFEEYLRRYPDGEFAELARARINELRKKEAQHETTAASPPSVSPESRAAIPTEGLAPDYLKSVHLSGGSVAVYPRCTNCAYVGFLYVATVSVHLENRSETTISLAVLAESLSIGSCNGNQYGTRGLVALEEGKPMEPESFTTIFPGTRVTVTSNLNEHCLQPLMEEASVDVSLVLLVREGGRILRLPVTAANVPLQVAR